MEQPLQGGNAGGAVLVEGTVRRPAGAWTPAVHALLRYSNGYAGSIANVPDTVTARITAHVQDVCDLAGAGNPLFARLAASGVLDALDQAMLELAKDRPQLEAAT